MLEIKVPSPGESVTEVEVARWLVEDGDYVDKDQEIAELDSDKATLSVVAEKAGVVHIKVKEGDAAAVGDVLCTIDTGAEAPARKASKPEKASAAARPSNGSQSQPGRGKEKAAARPAEQAAASTPPAAPAPAASPVAERMMRENRLSPQAIPATGAGGRITKADVERVLEKRGDAPRTERREKMSLLRRKVSERLVSVRRETAMLTTFNEVDMGAVADLRRRYKEAFRDRYGVGLGFMSFFTRAVCEALQRFPVVNARIDGTDIVYHDYCDIGIAVSAPKGLMVPVIRNAETLSLAGIEQQVMDLASRARDGRLSIEEMTGGTFTLSNGGVFGSMLSTPILNPPQSAILGMHNIVERPVARQGEVVVRPVMYVALSYDHRLIDGKESVSFLVAVKEMLEDPAKMLFGGGDPEKILLGL